MEGGGNIQERDDEPLISTSVQEETRSGCWFSWCDPRGGLHRFVALIFMCFLGFGSYFCYDNPAALEDAFTKDLNLTTTEYMMFYSIYSWPNVVLCFIGGFLVDSVFGIRLGTNIYMTLTLAGHLVFASGVLCNRYWLMIVGRFIFGIGAESLAVAQNNYAVLWFKGKELNMVFGLQLSFARIGSTVNFLVMQTIYNWVQQEFKGPEGLGIVLFIAGTTCIFSMICALVLGLMDKRAERILDRNQTEHNREVVKLTDVKDFGSTFWLVTVICVSYYSAIFPFIGLGKNFFMSRFHMTQQQANSVNSIVYLLSGFASPIIGFLIDKSGKNIFWILLAVLTTTGSHLLLAFSSLNPYVAMVTMGIAYSCLASSLWPLVSLIIPEYQLGTAYGVCQAIQNLGLAVFSIVAGKIEDKYGYTWMEAFFISSLGAAFVATLTLWVVDMSKGGNLNMTPLRRLQTQQRIRLRMSRGRKLQHNQVEAYMADRFLSGLWALRKDWFFWFDTPMTFSIALSPAAEPVT